MLTAMFVFVILFVTSKLGHDATARLVNGLALTVVHLIGVPLTSTSMNPDRSLGPALMVGGTAVPGVAAHRRVLYPSTEVAGDWSRRPCSKVRSRRASAIAVVSGRLDARDIAMM
jgi:hypothetical protein